ncbi:MAG: nucleoside 2-deoxyribosyltransferase [Candidatus Bathyarchaeia archaeon]
MKVFLAAPLFSEAEREFNSKIAKRLRENGFEVWLAQEAPFIQQGTHKEKKRIYEGDISALKASDAIAAVLDGVEVDAGVAYEMGYATALGKPIVGLKTDYRTFSEMEEVNLMLEVALIKICKSMDELIDSLSKVR